MFCFFFIYILNLHWNTISVCTQANLFVSMPHVFMYTCGVLEEALKIEPNLCDHSQSVFYFIQMLMPNL